MIISSNVYPPKEFTDYLEYTYRTKTGISINWNINSWEINTEITTPNLRGIIQEIVNSHANDLVIFVEPTSGTGDARFFSFDSGTPPELLIQYATGGPAKQSGKSYTCENEIYVSNKNVVSQIEYIFTYDGSYSSNLLDEDLPLSLAGTMVYFGSDYPFNSLAFDLTDTGGNSITWEYYGGSWKPISIVTDVNDYDNFNRDGVGAITWLPNSDWVKTSINNETLYWVRANFNTLGSSPTQVNSYIYSPVGNFAIAETIGGDIPAYGAINISNINALDGNAKKIIVATRSEERGDDFIPHINAPGQNSLYAETSGDQIETLVQSPAGEVRRTTWGGAASLAERWKIVLKTPLSQQYYGRYRAFARGYAEDISDGDVTSYLSVTLGTTRTTKTVGNIETRDNYHYFDYGIVSIPPAMLPVQFESDVIIKVFAGNTYGAMNFDWIDLILVPIDEYVMEINQVPTSNTGDLTIVDSTTFVGRGNMFSALRKMSDYKIYDIPQVIAPAPIQLRAGAKQKIYFFVLEDSTYEWLGKIQMRKNERYLTFRGRS